MADDTVDVSSIQPPSAEYLGDGLYVDFDGWQVRLWADRGPDGLSEVYLEPDVLVSFLRYVEKLKAYAAKMKGASIVG